VARWQNDQQRERALWWLRFNLEAGREQQANTLIRRADWDIKPVKTWQRLWASLEAPLG
jgi:hypothetical protein